jgi:hypothetical protein
VPDNIEILFDHERLKISDAPGLTADGPSSLASFSRYLRSTNPGWQGGCEANSVTALKTAKAFPIIPDLLFLSSSGDVIIVEVKPFIDHELGDRYIIAQLGAKMETNLHRIEDASWRGAMK